MQENNTLESKKINKKYNFLKKNKTTTNPKNTATKINTNDDWADSAELLVKFAGNET